ncbi:unnamed protein product [Urochloa decumbens]|uniref:Uncharacterized protein n=1 Tax=Urochloa decumbens TaxID=240449 RepID=A0ABC8X3P9_9POAL
MAPALPRAALLVLLLASAARSQDEASEPPASAASPLPGDTESSGLSPISQPPTSSASAPAAAHSSPPAPPETSPIPSPSDSQAPVSLPHKPTHPAAPAPAPAPAAHKKEADKDDDEGKSSPAPAPAAEQIKASNAAEQASGDGDEQGHEEMNGGKKAGVVVGAFTAAAVVGLGCFVWRKRRANIRRARYAEYAARLELV